MASPQDVQRSFEVSSAAIGEQERSEKESPSKDEIEEAFGDRVEHWLLYHMNPNYSEFAKGKIKKKLSDRATRSLIVLHLIAHTGSPGA